MTQTDASDFLPLVTWTGEVPMDWLDYNGHMTEHRYLQVCGEASDKLYQTIGVDFSRAEDGAFYTLQTHLVHLDECRQGASLQASSEILGYDEKRLHLFHRIRDGKGRLLATGEHLSIHVARGKSCPASTAMLEQIASLYQVTADRPLPEGTGAVLRKDLEFHR
ncbi:thioesterase family protein [Shinella daejeonensis]|uniref:thioesterase family protein n=1 Tax=Shinella daejeonensis TaxID=659017 RepID=UPI0020C82997|nr:thioesterase family protein [Shinella daejeonensis]MCP8897469.1 thioesterase family protein [Shinella daejeonensis]